MEKWIIDPDHSVAAFSVKHMMVTNVRGQFNKIAGTIHFDPSDIAHSSVEAEIDVSGIYTGIKKRDEHLSSPDFFDIAKYSKIVCKSTGVEITASNQAIVAGNLTIRDITHPVVLDVEYFGPVKGTEGETTMGFSAATRINREDFGMTLNYPLEGSGFVIGKEVEITLEVEADLAE